MSISIPEFAEMLKRCSPEVEIQYEKCEPPTMYVILASNSLWLRLLFNLPRWLWRILLRLTNGRQVIRFCDGTTGEVLGYAWESWEKLFALSFYNGLDDMPVYPEGKKI